MTGWAMQATSTPISPAAPAALPVPLAAPPPLAAQAAHLHPPLSPWSHNRSNSLPLRRTKAAPVAAVDQPDGILMLLEACETLDIHPRLLGHRSARCGLCCQAAFLDSPAQVPTTTNNT